MYPSRTEEIFGVFVLNQFNELKSQLNHNDNIDFYFMKRTMTNFLGSVIKCDILCQVSSICFK